MPKKTTGDRPELNPINVGAAAVDIGSKIHMAAVNPAWPVRSFGTFIQDLHGLSEWFKASGVTSVAMESTGGVRARSARREFIGSTRFRSSTGLTLFW
jgi:transposase